MSTTGLALSPSVQRVTIYVAPSGDILRVVRDPFYISKGKHESVVWQTDPPNAAFRVVFDDDSPFYNTDFDQSNPYSGEARRDVPGDGKEYKYSVKGGANTIDPGGVVNP